MKPKNIQISNLPVRSPFKTNKFDPPIEVINSMDNSVKKSQSSTYLTERSSSRNKVMISNSHKLTTFFSSSRPHSLQRSYSTVSTQNRFHKKMSDSHGQEKRSPQIQHMKYNLNQDYFDQNTSQNFKGRNDKTKQSIQKKGELNTKTRFYRDEQKRATERPLNRLNSYKSQTLLHHEKQIEFPKIKHPNPKVLPHKFFVKPLQKQPFVKQKEKKNKVEKYDPNNYKKPSKTPLQNQFQYTFGLNY